MKSCQDYLSELREKLHLAEDQLRLEKINLCKTDELFTEEKEKWAKELKAEQLRVHSNQKEIKKKETRLEELKAEHEEVLKRIVRLEDEHEKLKKEIQKAKIIYQDEMNKYLLEQGNLEKELSKVQERQKDLKLSNKWAKVFQEKNLKAQQEENDSKLKDEIKLLSDEFTKKIEAFDENLKEIDRARLKPRQQKLKEMQETLAQITAECEDIEKKNKNLEREIELLKK